MNIEENIFKRATINYSKIINYGFKKNNDLYLYETNILNDTFKVIITVDKGIVKGKIIDLGINEEYNNFRIKDMQGEFVTKIKNEFEKILLDIKDKCFDDKYFVFDQANRITDKLIEKYNSKPEFLWNTPDAIFRKNGNKWYAIIMNIPKNKIDIGDEQVEVINVKLEEDKIEKLLNKKGFYKAYHMNKKKWITIILDNTLKDEEILKYIDDSYLLVR